MDSAKFRPKKIRKSMISDSIHPEDFANYPITYCCEQCSHFNPKKPACTLGFDCTPHLKINQDAKYHLSGRVMFCRFLEID